jgi:hypothetical protein
MFEGEFADMHKQISLVAMRGEGEQSPQAFADSLLFDYF